MPERIAKTVEAIRNDGLYIDGVRFPYSVGAEIEVANLGNGRLFGVKIMLFADEVTMATPDAHYTVRVPGAETDPEWMAAVHRGRLLEMAEKIGLFGPDDIHSYSWLLEQYRREVRDREWVHELLGEIGEQLEAGRFNDVRNALSVARERLAP